jgi:hypothetical protein
MTFSRAEPLRVKTAVNVKIIEKASLNIWAVKYLIEIVEIWMRNLIGSASFVIL